MARCPDVGNIGGKHKVTLFLCKRWIDEKWIEGITPEGVKGHNMSATGLWGWLQAHIIESAGFAILVYADGRNKIRYRCIVDRIRVREDGVIVGWFGVKLFGRWWRICPFTMEVL